MRVVHDHYEENKPTTVNVYPHDSGMVYHHDYACTVCSVHHAVLDLNEGVFRPCRKCEALGWTLVKKKPKTKNIIQRLFRC